MAIIISMIFLFIGIGTLILIRVCIVGRMLRRGELNTVERGGFGNTSMSQEDIEKLPCFDFKEKDKGRSSPLADCAVCLENFLAGEKCRLLPLCNHSFHAECVDLWLLRAPICPICRADADLVNSRSLFGGESGSGVDLGEVQTAEERYDRSENAIQISDREMGLNPSSEIVDLRRNESIGDVSETATECTEHSPEMN